MTGKSIRSLINILEVISARLPVLARCYYHTYGLRNKPIIRSLNLTNTTHVLVIGGGAVPHTAIRIARETGARVVTLDNREQAVELAGSCIDKFGAREKVESVCGDGLTYPLTGFDVIWITLYVNPKGKLISRVLREAQPGVRIVFMKASGLTEKVFYPVQPFELTGYRSVEIGVRNIFASYRAYVIEGQADSVSSR